jgi:hypothetical protein
MQYIRDPGPLPDRRAPVIFTGFPALSLALLLGCHVLLFSSTFFISLHRFSLLVFLLS